MDKKNGKEYKWYYRGWAVVLALFCFGPLALFLVWYKPGISILNKWIITIIVLLATIWIGKASLESYRLLYDHYYELMEVVQRKY